MEKRRLNRHEEVSGVVWGGEGDAQPTAELRIASNIYSILTLPEQTSELALFSTIDFTQDPIGARMSNSENYPTNGKVMRARLGSVTGAEIVNENVSVLKRLEDLGLPVNRAHDSHGTREESKKVAKHG